MVFNTTKRGRKASKHICHNIGRETFAPSLYCVGSLQRNQKTGPDWHSVWEGIIDVIRQVLSDLANDDTDWSEDGNVVCPTPLRTGVYTAGNVDNIDHNPSSTSASDAFYGTAISLTQHATASSPDTMCKSALGPLVTNDEWSQRIRPLPESYVLVPPTQVDKFAHPQNATVGFLVPGSVLISSDDSHQWWLAELHRVLENGGPDVTGTISWPACNASVKTRRIISPAVTALLSVFRDTTQR